MLISVNPGIVFISFNNISPFSFKKKSTLDSPLPPIALYAFIAIFFISSATCFSMLAGIIVLEFSFSYFAS